MTHQVVTEFRHAGLKDKRVLLFVRDALFDSLDLFSLISDEFLLIQPSQKQSFRRNGS